MANATRFVIPTSMSVWPFAKTKRQREQSQLKRAYTHKVLGLFAHEINFWLEVILFRLKQTKRMP